MCQCDQKWRDQADFLARTVVAQDQHILRIEEALTALGERIDRLEAT